MSTGRLPYPPSQGRYRERVGLGNKYPQNPKQSCCVLIFKTLSWFCRCWESNKQSQVAAKLRMSPSLNWEEGNLILDKPHFSKILIMSFQPRGTARKIGWGVRPASQNCYPIYDQNLRYSLPDLWSDQKFETLFMTSPLHQKPCFRPMFNYCKHNLWRAFVDFLSIMMKKWLPLENPYQG